jgi:HK97 family phage portal protein
MLPALTDSLRSIWSGFGGVPITLGLKSTVDSFDTLNPPSIELLERNGYYGIIQALTGGREREFELSAFYGGVRIIAEDMGAMPFKLYERSRDRNQSDLAVTHPLFPVLLNLVNPDVSAGEFVEALTAHAITTGNGFAEIQRMGGSVFLWPWKPSEVRMDTTRRGRMAFIHKEGNAPEKTYSRDRVFHLKGFTLTGLEGDSLINRCRRSLGIANQMERYAGNYFESDATPGVVIRRPATPGKPIETLTREGIQRFKEEWARWHRGAARSHEPALLQEGMEIDRARVTAAEAQLREQREFAVIEICRWLRLSPHKLADLSRASLNNIEHLAIEYTTTTLGPWISRWQRAVHRCLLTTDEQIAQRLFAEHDVAVLQRGDFATQAEGFRKLLEKGVYSINEVRRWLRLNPVPGGDERFVQLNLGTVQDVAAGLTLRKVEPQPAAGE